MYMFKWNLHPISSHILKFRDAPFRPPWCSRTPIQKKRRSSSLPVRSPSTPTSTWCSWFFFLFHGENHEGNIHKLFINSDEDEDEDQDEDDDDGGGDLMMMMMWWRWFDDDDDDGGGDLMMMMMMMIMIMVMMIVMIVILWYCDIIYR